MAIESQQIGRVLLVQQDAADTRRTLAALQPCCRTIQYAQGEYEALQLLALSPCNLVILGRRQTQIGTAETIRLIFKSNPHMHVLVLEEPGHPETIDSQFAGHFDRLDRHQPIEDLVRRVRTILLADTIKDELHDVREYLRQHYGITELIGRGSAMTEVFTAIQRVANSDVTVLIQGESGTGKELVAREIHRHSRRSAHPFIAVNCAAIPEALLESELFGHEKGAFTGAAARRNGRFELAHNGTLFLDEIGDMSPMTQAKILRVLQEHTIERVGGTETLTISVRIITATNRKLEEEVARGSFRHDLYYRINVFPITLPPLRDRKDNIPLLATYIIQRLADRDHRGARGLSPDALRALEKYHWPGNVRELENALERALLLCDGATIEPEHLHFGPQSTPAPPAQQASVPADTPEIISERHNAIAIPGAPPVVASPGPPPGNAPTTPMTPEHTPENAATTPLASPIQNNTDGITEDGLRFTDTIVPLEEIERQYLTHAVKLAGGNLSRAANLLRIGRATLYRKLQKYNIQTP